LAKAFFLSIAQNQRIIEQSAQLTQQNERIIALLEQIAKKK
jgi:hypothetical protein